MNIEAALPSEKFITIKGTFTNDCMQMSEVKILKRTANVVEILPLATMANNAEVHESNMPFTKTFVVSGKYSGHVLYHVRSLQWASIESDRRLLGITQTAISIRMCSSSLANPRVDLLSQMCGFARKSVSTLRTFRMVSDL